MLFVCRNSFNVSWNLPTDTGGEPIVEYTVQLFGSASTRPLLMAQVKKPDGITKMTFPVVGLKG